MDGGKIPDRENPDTLSVAVLTEKRRTSLQFLNHAISVSKADPAMSYRSAVGAIRADGSNAEAWLLLGIQLRDMGNEKAACAAYRAGLRCQTGAQGSLRESAPGDLQVLTRHKLLVNLGHSLMNDGQMEAALAVTEDAIASGMGLSEVQGLAFAHTNKSLVMQHLGMAGSVDEARVGHDLFYDPLTELGLAFAMLFDGQYAQGLKHFQARFPYRLPHLLNMPYHVWDGSHVDTLLIVPDMGLGDTLSFARFVRSVSDRVKRVIFMVQPELVTLLRGAMVALWNVEVVVNDSIMPPADAWCAVFSLPVALGLNDEEIRHYYGFEPLSFDGSKVAWDLDIDDQDFNIAISWAGAPGNEIDKHRSIPVTEFLSLLEVPGVKLWSVQVGQRSREMHDLGLAAMVTDLSPMIRDAADTAGVLRRMDLIVTCESFLGHLAGALDLPCWVAASKRGRDWRIGTRGERPLWYDKTRIWRQGDDLAWPGVFARMVEELKNATSTLQGKEWRGGSAGGSSARGADDLSR